MRACWNWQTGTFEGRVSLTYGFKSRRSHLKHSEIFRMLFSYSSVICIRINKVRHCLLVSDSAFFDKAIFLKKTLWGNGAKPFKIQQASNPARRFAGLINLILQGLRRAFLFQDALRSICLYPDTFFHQLSEVPC